MLRGFGAWAAFLMLIAIMSDMCALPTLPPEVRFVPQPRITGLAPVAVTFKPGTNNALVVLNRHGRIDILDTTDPENSIKQLEIRTAATTVALTWDGTRLVSGERDGTIRLWDAVRGDSLGNSWRGHRAPITSIAFSRDGTRVVSGDTDGTVRLWDAVRGRALGDKFAGHEAPVVSIGFDRDGSRIVSADSARRILLWDVKSRVPTWSRPLPADTGNMKGVVFTQDGTRIVSAGIDPQAALAVTMWDVESREAISTARTTDVRLIETVAFSPNGGLILFGTADGLIRSWDVERGEVVEELMFRHGSGVRSLAFSSDGTRIVSAGSEGAIRLWDLERGESVGEPFRGIRAIRSNPVASVAFSSDGARVVSADSHGAVNLWYVDRGLATDGGLLSAGLGTPEFNYENALVRVAFGLDGVRILSGARDGPLQLWNVEGGEGFDVPREPTQRLVTAALSPDGTTIASGYLNGIIRVWNADRGETLDTPMELGEPPLTLTLSRNGARIAAGGLRGIVRLWNSERGEPVGVPLRLAEAVTSMALSSDGTRVAAGGLNGTLRIWNEVEPGTFAEVSLLGHDAPVSTLAFSADGNRIVSGAVDGTLRLWDVGRGESGALRLLGHAARVFTVAFSPDGTRIASGGGDGTLRFWDADSGDPVADPLHQVSSEPRDAVQAVALTPNGMRIASLGHDGTVHLWNMELDEILRVPLSTPADAAGHVTLSVALSPDGTHLVAGGLSDRQDSLTGTIRTWDLGNPGRTGILSLPSPGEDTWRTAVASLVYSPDGARFASGGADGTVRVWALAGGAAALQKQVGAHAAPVLSLAYSPNGNHIASGGADGTVRLWRATGEAIPDEAVGAHEGHVRSVTFSLDGTRILSGGNDGTTRQWNVRAPGAPAPRLRHSVGQVVSVAYSPDGQRIVSGDDGGNVALWHLYDYRFATVPISCALTAIQWLATDAIVVDCDDRLVFLNSDLERTGEIFLLSNGLVAVVDGHGVYAWPPFLRSNVLALDGAQNLREADPTSARMMRGMLFHKQDNWLHIRNAYAFLGYWSYLLWLMLISALIGYVTNRASRVG